jgi:hypothetical protein
MYIINGWIWHVFRKETFSTNVNGEVIDLFRNKNNMQRLHNYVKEPFY